MSKFAHVECSNSRRRARDGRPGFAAKYRGTCKICDKHFGVGDRISYVAGDYVPAPQTVEPYIKIIIEDTVTDPTPEIPPVVAPATDQHEHKSAPIVLKWIRRGHHVWLTGPTGSGKTTLVERAAAKLGKTFYYSGALNDSFGLAGFKDAHGVYARTLFREAYEHGGIFLLDEVDACDPSALLWLAGALANGVAAFPDGMIKRHADFVCVCAANTWGHGATHEYVGRMKQDAAFLDRFVQIAVDYDTDLERTIAIAINPKDGARWQAYVAGVRNRGVAKGLRVIVSPRATLAGARALLDGDSWQTVCEEVIAARMTAEQWDSVR